MKKHSKSDKDEIEMRISQWKELKIYLRFHVTIQDLSRDIGINRTYLSNYINETYGKNFNNWVNGLRIDEAKKHILSNSSDSLSETARQVGFADLAHFSKIFKRTEGLSPSDWKKLHKKSPDTLL